MRSSRAALLAGAVLSVWVFLGPLSAVEPLSTVEDAQKPQEPADPTGQPVRTVLSSDKTVVKDVVYGLEEERSRLYLTSQPLDGANRQPKRVELKFTVPEDGRIVELSLTKMGVKNLMAVVKVRRGDKFDFYCLTFIGPWDGGHVRDKFAFYQAKFFTTRDDLKILSIGGKHFAGSAFVVLGDMGLGGQDGQTWMTEGVFYFSGCPWPPSDGALSHFRVTVDPRKDVTD
jgi:hypothetical protein